jgi:hypothetical protein
VKLRAAFPALLALTCCAPAGAAEVARPELVLELSAYYTNLDWYLPLTGRPIPQSGGDSEFEVYRDLFLQSLRPQLLLLEASVNPMPIAGAWVRRRHPVFYRDATIGSVNWIEAVTAGFQEPAAVSVFLGSAMNFVRPGQPRKGTNKGHIGYLASFGTQHIAHNVLVQEPWYELEWKLKGERHFAGDHLSWSFRLGTKQHSDRDIADTVYVGMRRGNIDYHAPFLSWLRNSDVDVAAAMAAKGLATAQFLVGKSYPLSSMGLAMELQAGVIYESERLYTGRLSEPRENLIFVLRPNLAF